MPSLPCWYRPNRDFWIALGVVCDDKVAKAKELLGETEEGVATGGLHKVRWDETLCARHSTAIVRPN